MWTQTMLAHYRWFFELLIWLPPTLMAISWRESIKAWVCHLRGDPTIKSVGATSFSMNNLDPLGSAFAPVLLIIGHSSVYGWAHATKIRSNFLKLGQTDVILAVCAGFLANFVMAVAWAELANIAAYLEKQAPHLSEVLLIASQAGVQINATLIAIHLLPLPPLDMSYIIRSYLPRYPKAWYTYADPVGQPLIFLLFLFNIAPRYINPITHIILEQVHWVVKF